MLHVWRPFSAFRAVSVVLEACLLATCLLACGSDEDVVSGPFARPSADAGSAVEPAGSTSSGMDGSVSVATSRDAGSAGDASADAGRRVLPFEQCDGLDNDENGIVDDLDVGKDGVCDCLRIATLGLPGGSGKGDVFGAWLNTRSNEPAVALGGMTLTPQLLAPYQILVVQDLHTLNRSYDAAELDALEAWVKAGGGLMTLIGYANSDERTNVNAMLARFGASYGELGILRRLGSVSVPVTTWIHPHPVTEGVSKVGVDNGYPVLGAGTTLAQEGGFDLLKVQEVGMGHLIVWGDEWITYDSEWSDHADYQVAQFWVNAIKWLTVARVCQVPPLFL
jgi:hypothetical protein